MPTDNKLRYEGKIIAAQGNGFFKVQITEKHTALCKLSGKMTTKIIKVVDGDTVDVEIDPYDINKGRIIFRRK